MKLNLLTWQEFLTGFNGKAFFVGDVFLTGEYLHLFICASGCIGYEAIDGPECFFDRWPSSWNALSITVLE